MSQLATPDAMPAAFTVLRADARASLASWTAPTSGLERTRRRMLGVLDDDPTAMWREHSPVHFTASVVVLSPALDEVALTLHGKAKRWFQFGGHLEAADASVANAARREGLEESGLTSMTMVPCLVQVDAHELSSAFGRCREHLDLRYAAIADTHELTVSDESDAVRWWRIDELPADVEPGLREAIQLAREAARG